MTHGFARSCPCLGQLTARRPGLGSGRRPGAAGRYPGVAGAAWATARNTPSLHRRPGSPIRRRLTLLPAPAPATLHPARWPGRGRRMGARPAPGPTLRCVSRLGCRRKGPHLVAVFVRPSGIRRARSTVTCRLREGLGGGLRRRVRRESAPVACMACGRSGARALWLASSCACG